MEKQHRHNLCCTATWCRVSTSQEDPKLPLKLLSLKYNFIKPQLLSIKIHKSEVFDNPPLCCSPRANQLHFETKGASDLGEEDVQSRPCWQLQDLSFRALPSSPCQGPPPEGVAEAQDSQPGPEITLHWFLLSEIHTNAEETRTAFHRMEPLAEWRN